MRRWIALCAALLLLCGCVQHSEKDPITIYEDFSSPVTEEIPYEEPPYMLCPGSLDDLNTLFHSSSWPTDVFYSYICSAPQRTPYGSNGIYSLEDVLELKEALSAVPFPILSDICLSPKVGSYKSRTPAQ